MHSESYYPIHYNYKCAVYKHLWNLVDPDSVAPLANESPRGVKVSSKHKVNTSLGIVKGLEGSASYS